MSSRAPLAGQRVLCEQTIALDRNLSGIYSVVPTKTNGVVRGAVITKTIIILQQPMGALGARGCQSTQVIQKECKKLSTTIGTPGFENYNSVNLSFLSLM